MVFVLRLVYEVVACDPSTSMSTDYDRDMLGDTGPLLSASVGKRDNLRESEGSRGISVNLQKVRGS